MAASTSLIRWIPSSSKAIYENYQITKLWAVCYGAKPISTDTSDGPQTNHWVFFAQIGGNAAIRIDPSVGDTQGNLVLIASKKDYVYSNNGVKVVGLEVSGSMTIKQFLDAIFASKFHQYRFSAGGQGCRFWLYTVVGMLYQSGKVAAADFQTLSAALASTWGTNGEVLGASQTTGITQGTFY